MNNMTELLQEKLSAALSIYNTMQRECKAIYDAYWKTDANTNVGGLSSDSDPATVNSKLTKANYVNGVTLCQQLNNFFSNQAVTQADYLQSILQARYGNAVLATALSVATESIGDRIKQICIDCETMYNENQNILDLYVDSNISSIMSSLDDEDFIFGSEMTKAELNAAVTLLQQFNYLIGNSSVTTGDYSATIAAWNRLFAEE